MSSRLAELLASLLGDFAKNANLVQYRNQILKQKRDIYKNAKIKRIQKIVMTLVYDSTFEDKLNASNESTYHLLPVKDGKVFDFRTLTMRDRVREDMYTYECDVTYLGAEHECPNASKFLCEIFSRDMEMVDFIVDLCGYFMTNALVERNLFVFYGIGDSYFTLMNIVNKILGPYGGGLCGDIFQGKTTKDVTSDLSQSIWRRVSKISSFELNRLSKERLTKLVNGGLFPCRAMYGKPKETMFNTKLVLYVYTRNNEIEIPEHLKDHIKIICFKYDIANHQEDAIKHDWRIYIGIDREDLGKKHLDEFFTIFANGANRWFSNGMKLKYPKQSIL
jgi:hypothetical protein